MTHTEYNGYLVALSMLIASVAGYVALDLAGRVTAASGRSRTAWVAGSATAMGVGIWSMHFVAMLALRMPIQVDYDVLLLMASVVIAIAGSAVTFLMSARERIRSWELAVASLFMGPAIAGMHYVGMAAMRMEARVSYDARLYRLSIAIAILVSFVALQLAVRLRDRNTRRGHWLKVASACVMGAAVYGMHYTGMTAARFTYDPAALVLTGPAIDGSESLALAVAMTTMLVLALAVIGAVVDRHIKARAAETATLRVTERTLRQTMDVLRAVVDSSPAAIIATDLDLLVTSWNPAAEALLGWQAKEIMGRSYTKLVPAEELRKHSLVPEAALRGSPTMNLATIHRRKDGSALDVSVSLAVLSDEGSNARGFIFLVADETHRKRLESRVRQSQRMEAIGQLAGGVAHDFNNLLTAITSYAEFLLRALDSDDSRREDAVAIREAASRAAGLTKQLLAFSRQQVRQPEILCVNAVVLQLHEMVRRLLPENIQLVMELDEELGYVNADPGQVEQIVMNLVVNSRDAMPKGGDIVVRTANVSLDGGPKAFNGSTDLVSGDYVMLTVADTGGGMTPEVQARMFEPFFTTKGPGSGTGLGLATVYGIVQQNEGHVWVDSAPGRGSRFHVLLRAMAGMETPDAPAVAAGLEVGGRETVLVVEDDQLVRAVAVRTLRDLGYTVVEAANGREALDRLTSTSHGVDIVVTDLVMPEMSGHELAKELQARHPRLRMLFISGYSRDAVEQPGLLTDGSAYMEKPFTPEALARKVREILDEASVTPIEAIRAQRKRQQNATVTTAISAKR